MSDSKQARREARARRRGSDAGTEADVPAAAAAANPGHAGHSFAVVASGENVVMVNTATGQTWAMATDGGGGPVWHPVEFSAGAPRAPRRGKAEKKAEEAPE